MRAYPILALLLLGCSTPRRAPLQAHSGENYSLRAPQNARFKKHSRIDNLAQGKVKVNAELWDSGDEGGVSGGVDVPVMRSAAPSSYGSHETGDLRTNQGLGRALNDEEILDAVSQGQLRAMDGQFQAQKIVSKLGNRGREIDFTVPNRKLQGRMIYLWGHRRLYFCAYATYQKHWDEARAQSVLNSFRFSRL